MFAWTSHGTELKRFTRQPITRAAIAVMLLIPLLYGAMYVWAFWDPTTRMDDLPVALVNADVAAKDDDGALQHYGTDVVDELTDNADLGWVVTDATSAAQGLDAGKYYFSVTIPSDFTARINGLAGKNPQAANVLVSYDDSNSFLATRLGQSAMLQLQSALREKVSKEAVDTLLVGVGDARDGFNTASDGAFRLSDGLSDAASGATKLNVGAAQLAEGAKALAAGNTDAATGASQLTAGLDAYVTGVSTAAAGAQQLSQGAAGLSDLQAGLAQTADPHTGAPALAVGIQQLAASLSTLTGGVTSFTSGADTFVSGANSWVAGAQTWRSSAYAATGGSLTSATSQLASGAGDLAAATASNAALADGAKQVGDGATSLAAGLGDVNAEVAAAMRLIDTDPAQAKAMLAEAQSHLSAAKSSASGLATGADQVSSGIAGVHAGATDLASGATTLNTGWGQLHAALAPDSDVGRGLDDLATGQQRLSAGATQLSAGATQLADPATTAQLQQLVAGSQTLASALTTMSAGAADAQHGIPALQAGANALAAGFTNPDPQQGLVSGATALDAGAHALASGLNQAEAGSVKVSAGATKLADSTPALASGLGQAHSGADELGTKLADGADQIPDDSAALRDTRAAAVSTPVTNEEGHVWPADSWGEGFAPFFISLALWVGALITWLLLRPLQTRALMTSVNGLRMAWGSLNSALLLSVGQVAIMLLVMHFAIGLNPKNVVATVLFSLLTAAAFFALQQFFQITLGSAVGKVVIIVLLMVQLASAGGTYPIQTTPDFLQAISPFMPMTYVVNGLREAITGGIEARFWASTAVLATIFVVSLAASSLAASRKRVWTMARLHPALSI